jgi:hypothetical protein
MILFQRAATSIQRFYRFYKGTSKSRECVLPPPTSPFVPPVDNAHLDPQDSHTHGDSENSSGGVGKYDSSSSRKTEESDILAPVVNYVSLGDVGVTKGKSSGMVGSRKTSTEGTSGDTIVRNKLSQDSRAPMSRDVSFATEHVSRSLAKSSRHNEPNSRKESSQVSSEGQTKVRRRMTIDLVKLESSAIASIESATCDVRVDTGLGLGK